MQNAEEDGHGYTQLLSPNQTGTLEEMKASMRNIKILIGDQDEATTELLGYYLEIFGVEPVVVTSTKDIRLKLREMTFDLLIVDLFLSGDVEKLMKDLRSTRKTYKLPVIALYSVQSEVNKDDVAKWKVNDILTKPFQFSEIISKIRKYVE
jgi:two-component system phosphate regulon response regulator OmpR